MRLSDILTEGHRTLPRRVEAYIDRNFYVYDDKVSSDDKIDYIIEESKAKYRIIVTDTSVEVYADEGSGATDERAQEIEAQLVAIATRPTNSRTHR